MFLDKTELRHRDARRAEQDLKQHVATVKYYKICFGRSCTGECRCAAHVGSPL